MPWCSDSDTLPSSLSNCVTALFSFSFTPHHAFDVSSFFQYQHILGHSDVVYSRLKRGKNEGAWYGGGGTGDGGKNEKRKKKKKNKKKKKKKKKTQKKKKNRLMIIKTSARLYNAQEDSREAGGRVRREGEGGREKGTEKSSIEMR